MVVFKVYLARSIAGMGVVVGVSVAVGKGVMVAVGMDDAVGVIVGAGVKAAQDERVKASSKRTRMGGVILFRMGCILPLVA